MRSGFGAEEADDDIGSYSHRTSSLAGSSFHFIIGFLAALGFGYGLWGNIWLLIRGCDFNIYLDPVRGLGNRINACENGEGVPDFTSTPSNEGLNATAFCIEWDDRDTWEALDKQLQMKYDTADGADKMTSSYICLVSAFAASIAALVIIVNGCFCPINGRYRAQIMAALLFIAATTLGITSLVFLSQTDFTDMEFWNELSQKDTTPCVDFARLAIQPPIIAIFAATIVAFINTFFVLKVCCAGCCTVMVVEA